MDIDGTYIGSQTSSSIFYDYWTSNNVDYNAMKFKNLTPGTHTIEVRAIDLGILVVDHYKR